jgi:hypothetical protein
MKRGRQEKKDEQTNNKSRFERLTDSSPQLCRGYLTDVKRSHIKRFQVIE